MRDRRGVFLIAAVVVVAVGVAAVVFWSRSNNDDASQESQGQPTPSAVSSAAISASSGGEATLEGVVTVVIPGGGVDVDANLQLAALTSPPTPDVITSTAGPAVAIDLSQPLLAPATIILQLDEALIDPALPVESIFAAYFDDTLGEWVLVPGIVDPAAQTITVTSTHFSWWTSLQANVNRLKGSLLAMTSLREAPPDCPGLDAVPVDITWSMVGNQTDAIGHCLRASNGTYLLNVSNNRGIPLEVGSDDFAVQAVDQANWVDQLVEDYSGNLIIPAGETRTFTLPASGPHTVRFQPSAYGLVLALIVDAFGLVPGLASTVAAAKCGEELTKNIPDPLHLTSEAVIAVLGSCVPSFLTAGLQALVGPLLSVLDTAVLVEEVNIAAGAKFSFDLGHPSSQPPSTQPPPTQPPPTQPPPTQPPSGINFLDFHDVADHFVAAWNANDRPAAEALWEDPQHAFDEGALDVFYFEEFWPVGTPTGGFGPAPYPPLDISDPHCVDGFTESTISCDYYFDWDYYGVAWMNIVLEKETDGRWFVYQMDIDGGD